METESGILGVVVGSVDIGESSRIVRLLTAERGRMSVVARGVRKKPGAVSEPGARVRVFARAGRGDLWSLRSAEVVVLPKRPRHDLDRLALLAYGCELASALAPEGQAAPKLYGLLCAWLDLLEGDAVPGVASRVALEAKALTFAGLGPALVRCARCRDPIEDPACFDAEAGGAVHSRCGGGAAVDVAALRAIEDLRRTPLADTPTLPDPPPWLLSDFARHHLGHSLKSRDLLEDLSRGPAPR